MLAEGSDHLRQPLGTGLHHFAREHVRVDQVGSQAFEDGGDGGLPGGDSAGEADVQRLTDLSTYGIPRTPGAFAGTDAATDTRRRPRSCRSTISAFADDPVPGKSRLKSPSSSRQLPVSFSRNAANASSEARVPPVSAGAAV